MRHEPPLGDDFVIRILLAFLNFHVDREFAGKVLSIAPIVQSSRISSREQRNLTDVSVAEVVVELDEPGPLTAGMKVDVYFGRDNP